MRRRWKYLPSDVQPAHEGPHARHPGDPRPYQFLTTFAA